MTKSLDNLGQRVADNLNRNVTAQAVIDEFAAREGHRHGPELRWDDVSAEFRTRFLEAYGKKAATQPVEDFVREFVDHWPPGLAIHNKSD